jgi:aryl-alcohol dehydrogenase-like predicted oxidoreductase|tara:strand:+ start:555 stop:758 length:204 start_codon:yes stop_codon:yes gene_type:complete
MEYAIDNGINIFDSSDLYGDGRSEQIIGKFISSGCTNREDVVIATKGGLLPHKKFYMPCNFSQSYSP